MFISMYKHVLQQWQWVVFLGAKPAQDEKQSIMSFKFLKQTTLT